MRLPRRARGGPIPPQNVRLVLRNGREIPVDCVYVGVRDGCHHWVSAWATVGDVAAIRVGMLPARTQVSVVAAIPLTEG